MTAKSERRASYENRLEQDGRLAGKHIKTLMHLQDLHSENDLLKARITELELQQTKAARCDLLEFEVETLRVRHDLISKAFTSLRQEYQRNGDQFRLVTHSYNFE